MFRFIIFLLIIILTTPAFAQHQNIIINRPDGPPIWGTKDRSGNITLNTPEGGTVWGRQDPRTGNFILNDSMTGATTWGQQTPNNFTINLPPQADSRSRSTFNFDSEPLQFHGFEPGQVIHLED